MLVAVLSGKTGLSLFLSFEKKKNNEKKCKDEVKKKRPKKWCFKGVLQMFVKCILRRVVWVLL